MNLYCEIISNPRFHTTFSKNKKFKLLSENIQWKIALKKKNSNYAKNVVKKLSNVL